MRLFKKLRIPLSATGIGFVCEMLFYCFLPAWGPATPAGPAKLQEVVALARAARLEYGSNHPSGIIGQRLIISDHPVTFARAALLRMNSPQHPGWAGTAVVCYPYVSYMANYDPDYSLVWGQMFVYGDPEIIRRLTGRAVDGRASSAAFAYDGEEHEPPPFR